MKEKIKRIADHYKLDVQSRQLNEECAELIEANCKYLRYSENCNPAAVDWRYLQNMCEEIADVEIMLEQMKYLLNINPEAIEEIKVNKINRQLERIENEK